jgi:hypothetical protein
MSNWFGDPRMMQQVQAIVHKYQAAKDAVGQKMPENPTLQSTQPIIGYRVWKLTMPECILRSAAYEQIEWPLRKPLERDEIHNAGIHALKIPSTVLHLWINYTAAVAGSIWMWGEVKEHSFGYLAEFAYPRKLWMPEETDPLTVMKLEENYGVPVELRAEFKKHVPPHLQQNPFANAAGGLIGQSGLQGSGGLTAQAFYQLQQAELTAQHMAQLQVHQYIRPGAIIQYP